MLQVAFKKNEFEGIKKYLGICIGYISSASYNLHSKKVLPAADSRNPWIRGFQQTPTISASYPTNPSLW